MTQATPAASESAARIRDCIVRFAATAENRIDPGGIPEPAWDEPLVGFSRGDDPLYAWFKEDIGPFYLTPQEIFAAAFPDAGAQPDELSVISWVLPQTERTRRDNAREQALPAERWARTRTAGEEFNLKLRDQVAAFLGQEGCQAVAPMRSPLFRQETSARYGLASTWSERHGAYVSGLGTFGLCDGLITARGKAMRCGTVIARIVLPPTERPYSDHHAYCLFFFNGSCGKCIKRCPAGAITRKGHDKPKCHAYIREVAIPATQSRFGFEANACGLCQTGVPCEAGIPVPGGP
jgi:epoxyqueuosine reductase QueG